MLIVYMRFWPLFRSKAQVEDLEKKRTVVEGQREGSFPAGHTILELG